MELYGICETRAVRSRKYVLMDRSDCWRDSHSRFSCPGAMNTPTQSFVQHMHLSASGPQLCNNGAEFCGNISRQQLVRIIHRNLLPAVFTYDPHARQEECTEHTARNNQAADGARTLFSLN